MQKSIKVARTIVQLLYIYFSAHTLVDTAKKFYAEGGRALYIDEIHKYRGWSTEIKMMYDQLPLLRVVYSGSSILDLRKGGADLSRRVIEYKLPVWSFREYLNLRMGWNLKPATLEEILNGKVDYPYGEHRPLAYFKEYRQHGCYYSDMERDLDIPRNSLPTYLEYLEKAELVSMLSMKANGDAVLRKMDKLYLNNSNMMYSMSDHEPNPGNVRETMFLSWMKNAFDVVESPISDFELDGKTFEVGGRKKGKKQIADASEGYIVADDIEYAYKNKIPLWMFGFIY